MKKILGKYYLLTCILLAFMWVLLPVHKTSAAILTLKDGTLENVTQAPVVTGEWQKTANGIYFIPTEGKRLSYQWVNVKNKIYYLGKKGIRIKGLVRYNDHLYFLSNKKANLLSGWIHKRYAFRETGIIATGLQTIDGKTYYFSSTGNWTSGWKKINDNDYYFNNKGEMEKNIWVKRGDKYYRLGKTGKCVKSRWITVNGKKYHMNKDGFRDTGYVCIKGTWYYFNENGVYDPCVKTAIDPNKKMVALTFDDGPGPYTQRLLDCLERNNAHATFFMVGNRVSTWPSTVKRMASIGCELGNHSWDHENLASLSSASIRTQISNTSAAIKKASGQNPTVCRLPYGSGHSSSWVLEAVGLPSIYWSVDPEDWAHTGSAQHTIDAVLGEVRNGDIILMHDIHAASVTAAETIIPELIRQGYQLVTVSELARYKGRTTLETGRTYYSFR